MKTISDLRDALAKTASASFETVQQEWYALWLIKEQTPEICLAAFNQDPDSIQYIKITI